MNTKHSMMGSEAQGKGKGLSELGQAYAQKKNSLAQAIHDGLNESQSGMSWVQALAVLGVCCALAPNQANAQEYSRGGALMMCADGDNIGSLYSRYHTGQGFNCRDFLTIPDYKSGFTYKFMLGDLAYEIKDGRWVANNKAHIAAFSDNTIEISAGSIDLRGPVVFHNKMDFNNNKITRIAAGTDGTDAVNLNQLREELNKGPGMVRQDEASRNIMVAAAADGAKVNFSGKNAQDVIHNRTLTGVASGVDDNDAVNMSQLKTTNNNITALTQRVETIESKLGGGQGGDKGPMGDKGPQGDKGPTGDKGSMGDKGPNGEGIITGPGGSLGIGGGQIGEGGGDIAIGEGSQATGGGSTAVGGGAKATGGGSTAVGGGAQASGDKSTALGGGAQATGDKSTAVGQGAVASGSHSKADGQGSKATGDYSTAIGQGATASGASSMAPWPRLKSERRELGCVGARFDCGSRQYGFSRFTG